MKKLLFACVLVACGGTTIDNIQSEAGSDGSSNKDSSATSDAGGRVPKNHRATATACPAQRGSDESQIPDGGGNFGACSQDSDCTQGTNGRCTWSTGGAHVLSCTYDQCASDSDCGGGTVCVCRSDATSSDVNFCGSSKSNCRVDADCGAGGYCSPSESSDTFCYSTDSAYFCHTPADECIDDADCGQDGSCNYDTTVKHWKCGTLCSPPPP